ncbi:DUF2914 domain-containing protein [Nevskia sp.]|uniref:DUF5924 family protein n=1 Tax=Nevskia sp. TaxID=1929292 RepID=UPI0025D7E63F|nr:DUF2914 domain-containing protein [Nevskia sp.]
MNASPEQPTNLSTSLPRNPLLERGLSFLARYPALLPTLSLAFGIGSFVLVQRGESMARMMAFIALIGWPWLLLEDLIGGWLSRHSRGRLPPATARFLTQQVQQELLYFSLPFLFIAMNWVPEQMAFVALAAGLALAATLDPLYWHRIAPNAGLSLAFHAACSFVAALSILPIAVHLPVELALPIAFATTSVILIASLPRTWVPALDLNTASNEPLRWRQRLRRFAMPLALATVLALAWFGRAAIPPAGLWVRDARITTAMDGHEPGPAITSVDAATLVGADASLSAFVAVRAPQGLSQAVVFEWVHDGMVVDRIPAQIDGGREAGFRTYSRKQHFGVAPQGKWRVDLRTPQGQLIARRNFEVR